MTSKIGYLQCHLGNMKGSNNSNNKSKTIVTTQNGKQDTNFDKWRMMGRVLVENISKWQ
jgi:hypothetical protein